jgi:YihY family inner membrane protein
MTPGADAQDRHTGSPLLRMLWLTVVKYAAIDGGQRAASFAYYAFFALFPLLLLLVAIGSYFYNPARVNTVVVDTVSHYVLVGTDKNDLVRKTIRDVIKARRGVGSVAVLGLVWSCLRFFQSLAIGVNRAWGTLEYSWWRLPIQNLLMVGILVSALPVGLLAPLLLRWVERFIWHLDIPYGAKLIVFGFQFTRFLLPSAIMFYGLSMFYMLAPRRRTTFREIWVGGVVATLLLQALQALFILYARNVAHFGAVYGAFGSVIAVLMWIYLSGSVIILGGCFCAARTEVEAELREREEAPAVGEDGGNSG